MANLKEQLIKLGSERPDIRNHLRPILAEIEKSALKLEKNRLNSIDFSIGGPMNRDHRIGDPIPNEAEWLITHKGEEKMVVTRGLSELRSKIEKASGMKLEDRDWKKVETLIERGDTAKVTIQLPSVEVYN